MSLLSIMNRPTRNLISNAALAMVVLAIAGCASAGVGNPRGVPVTEMKADRSLMDTEQLAEDEIRELARHGAGL